MRRFGSAGLAFFLVVLAACSTEPITPPDGSLPGSVVTPPPQATNEPSACSAATVESDLTALMAVITPNDQSALSKFNTVKALLASGDIAGARDYAQNTLIKFITTKFGQAPTADQQAQAANFAKVKAEILCFVGLFNIPTSNFPKVVVTSNQLMGIWFPEGFCDASCGGINVALDILTACTSPGVPAGCTPAPFGTLLDLYGNYLKVTLTGGTPNLLTHDAPVVAICAPDGTGGIVDQLRILHQDDGTSNTAGLTILDGVAIPTELDNLLLCDSAIQAGNAAPAPGTMFARMVNHLANLLLPEKASANMMFALGTGIGGTSRTFSPFVVGSTQLGATGGLGGTKGTFSPANPDAPAAAAPALTTGADGNLVDKAGVKQFTQLPGVYVKTGLGTAIPGATVTFSMLTPTKPENTPESAASVCDAGGVSQTTIVATTDASGFAALGCVYFGTVPGFKNLQASINPSTATGVAGAGIGEITVTACDPVCGSAGATTVLNWLVTTTPGDPAKLTLESMSNTATAGTAFSSQPVLKVRDQYDNVVVTSTAAVAASATAPANGTGGLINNSTPNAVSGVVTFSNLGIGGTAGIWNVAFSSGTLTGVNANVTVTAGAAATITTLMPTGPTAAQTFTYTTGLVPGSNVSPAPQIRVRDAYGNAVANEPLTWSPPLGSNGSVLTLGTAGTTNAAGTAQVTSWNIGDGFNDLDATITAVPLGTPAQFFATTPTGVANFSCTVGTSKQDLVPWTLPRPNASVKEVTIWMSVTGQSSFSQAYPAVLRVYGSTADLASGANVLGSSSATGGVTLPGNNGNPSPVTFSLTSAIPKASGNLYFKLTINAPGTRKFQLWYTSSPANGSDCAKVLMYTAYPNLNTTLKGLRIQLTN